VTSSKAIWVSMLAGSAPGASGWPDGPRRSPCPRAVSRNEALSTERLVSWMRAAAGSGERSITVRIMSVSPPPGWMLLQRICVFWLAQWIAVDLDKEMSAPLVVE